jgi:septal ring factor EnvC (AmiA/AmiB activator)
MAFSLGMTSVTAFAATAPVAMVENIAKDFESNKKQIEDAEVKQRKVLSALYEINKKMKKIVTEKGNLSQQRAQLEFEIKNLSDKVQSLEVQAKSQRALLAERLRAIYKLGGKSVARFIFASTDAASFDRNLKILGVVASRDLDLIKNYSHDLQELKNKKQAVADRLNKMKKVEGRITAQEKNMISEQQMKNKILDGTRKSKLFAMNRLNTLREKSMQFNVEDSGVYDMLFKPSFFDQKGQLPSPIQGLVTLKFGLLKNPNETYTISNKGIFIQANAETEVKSIFEGKVSFVGELPGFGQTIILDHGDHYYSVYSHIHDTKVNVGDEVSQSESIANVASAESDGAPGIYFEIRHFSEPYDPQQWMKGL